MRRCAVTRNNLATDELIRFVASPDGTITPDLQRDLPGRGVWITANKEVLEKAIAMNAFAKSLHRSVDIPSDLVPVVDRLLENAALNALSLCRKAGLVVTGFRQVDQAIRTGEALLVLHATDAARDGVRKLEQALHSAREAGGDDVAVKQIWHGVQLDLALGRQNVVHAAAIRGGSSQILLSRIRKLQGYRSSSDIPG